MTRGTGALRSRISRDSVVVMDEARRSRSEFFDGFARHAHGASTGASFVGVSGIPIQNAGGNTGGIPGLRERLRHPGRD